MVSALRNDYRTAPISEQDRTMLDYVVKLTKDATQCGPQDHDEEMRASPLFAALFQSDYEWHL